MDKQGVFPFLQLPYDLREEIYKTIITQSIVVHHRPTRKGRCIWPVTPISPNSLAIEMSSSAGVRLRHFILVSQLLYTNQQIYDEFSKFINQRIHHIKLFGDFQWGVKPTQQLLDSIKTWPGLFSNVRTIRIRLTIPTDRDEAENFWDEMESWRTHQEPLSSLARVQQSIRESYRHGAYDHEHGSRRRYPQRLLPPELYDLEEDDDDDEKHGDATKVPPFVPHDTLADLARVLDGFARLERIDIEPDAQNVLMLWPDPVRALRCFERFHARGVEVVVVMKQLQRWIFFAILDQVGVQVEESTLWYEDGTAMLSADVFMPASYYLPVCCGLFDLPPAHRAKREHVALEDEVDGMRDSMALSRI